MIQFEGNAGGWFEEMYWDDLEKTAQNKTEHKG
jgi:hypothetical protein